jgi:hypothetical protein
MSFTGRKMALIPYDRIDWFGNMPWTRLGTCLYSTEGYNVKGEIPGRLATSISSLISRDQIVTMRSLSPYPIYPFFLCYNVSRYNVYNMNVNKASINTSVLKGIIKCDRVRLNIDTLD